jgi:NAD-dependent deacetylase
MEDAEALAELIERHRPGVVLTGAGMSTESGIPDFRSTTGLWASVDPFEVASIEAFHRAPGKVWDFYRHRLAVLAEARPNPGHLALAELEAAGYLAAIVTQNVDTLHEQAGSRSVIEIHGSLREAHCPDCSRRVPRRDVVRQLEGDTLPVCPSCGAVLKPGVVMFGELLPEAEMREAEHLAARAPLLLVVGSSLQVWPAAALPQLTLAAGGVLAILNREPTSYDDDAALVIRAAAGETLAAVRDLVLDR